MADRDRGAAVLVSRRVLGDTLTAAPGIGATVLTLDDCADFPNDGGAVRIGGQDGEGGEVHRVSDVDDEASTITLATPLATAKLVEDRVDLHPLTVEWTAAVQVDDGDPLEAVIDHSLTVMLAEGAYDIADAPVVDIVRRGSRWHVADVVGSPAVMDGTALDPSTIPVPENYTYLGDVAVDQLVGDGLTAAVIRVANQLLAGEINEDTGQIDGRRVELTPAGLKLIDEDDTALVDLPTNPLLAARFTGIVEAAQIIVTSVLSVEQDGTIEGDAVLTLAASVTDPSAPPSVVLDYESLTLTRPTGDPTYVSIFYDGTDYLGLRAAVDGVIDRWSTAGSLVETVETGVASNPNTSRVTADATYYYLLQDVPTSTFNYLYRVTRADPSVVTSARINRISDRERALGYDTAAGHILLAEVNGSGMVEVRRYTFDAGGTTLTQQGSTVTSTTASDADLAAVVYTQGDVAADRYSIVHTGSARTVKHMTTAGVFQGSESFPVADGVATVGLAYHTSWRTFTNVAKRKTYTTNAKTTAGTWSAAYAWRRSGGTVLRTRRSPVAQFAMVKRARIKITGGTIPAPSSGDIPDQAQMYLEDSAVGAASYGVMQNQGNVTTDPVTLTVTAYDNAGGADATSNTFAGGVPGKTAATTGGFSVDGLSNGSVGTGTFSDSVVDLTRTDLFGGAARTARPYARLARTTSAQTITTGTWTRVTYNTTTEETDTAFGDHVADELVTPIAGLYLLTGSVSFAGNPSGATIRFERDTVNEMRSPNTSGEACALSGILRCAAGATLTMFVLHSTGADRSVDALGHGTWFSALWMGP